MLRLESPCFLLRVTDELCEIRFPLIKGFSDNVMAVFYPNQKYVLCNPFLSVYLNWEIALVSICLLLINFVLEPLQSTNLKMSASCFSNQNKLH